VRFAEVGSRLSAALRRLPLGAYHGRVRRNRDEGWRPTVIGLSVMLAATIALAFDTHGAQIVVGAFALASAGSLLVVLRRIRRWHAGLSPGAAASRVAPGPPEIIHFAAAEPRAFCQGWLRPRVYLSTTALFELTPGQLRGQLAHHRHHARRRDLLRLAVVEAVAGALPFIPALRPIVRDYAVRLEAAAAATAGAEPVLVAGCPIAARAAATSRSLADTAWSRRGSRAVAVACTLACAAAVVLLVTHAAGAGETGGFDLAAGGNRICLVVAVAVPLLTGATMLVGRRPPARGR